MSSSSFSSPLLLIWLDERYRYAPNKILKENWIIYLFFLSQKIVKFSHHAILVLFTDFWAYSYCSSFLFFLLFSFFFFLFSFTLSYFSLPFVFISLLSFVFLFPFFFLPRILLSFCSCCCPLSFFPYFFLSFWTLSPFLDSLLFFSFFQSLDFLSSLLIRLVPSVFGFQ